MKIIVNFDIFISLKIYIALKFESNFTGKFINPKKNLLFSKKDVKYCSG